MLLFISFRPQGFELKLLRNIFPVNFCWHDHVRNEEVLLRVTAHRNILHEISKRKANWIGHILRRNCLLQRVIAGKIKGEIEVTEDVGSYWMTLRKGEDTLI